MAIAIPPAAGASWRRRGADGVAASAGEIVANKVVRLARSRRALAEALAAKAGKELPGDFVRFFDALEAGRFAEAKALFEGISTLMRSEGAPHEMDLAWQAVKEAFGAAEVAQDWPAERLLDYGQAVLGALRPGMVYVGGTDAGRFIPTLLNETGDGEKHVILTQNALADGTYLRYLGHLYGERLSMPDAQDAQAAFSGYIQDAKKRFEHDRDFPDEPKQVRPGEDIRERDNRVQVSGQVAVMSINELLLQAFLNKNPEVGVALEESFPLKSTYLGAEPLGPLLELRAREAQSKLSGETASQALDYWQSLVSSLPADSQSPDVGKSYAKLLAAQANLFQENQLGAQAEAGYRLAAGLTDSIEPVVLLTRFLRQAGRGGEVEAVLQDYARRFPAKAGEANRLREP